MSPQSNASPGDRFSLSAEAVIRAGFALAASRPGLLDGVSATIASLPDAELNRIARAAVADLEAGKSDQLLDAFRDSAAIGTAKLDQLRAEIEDAP